MNFDFSLTCPICKNKLDKVYFTYTCKILYTYEYGNISYSDSHYKIYVNKLHEITFTSIFINEKIIQFHFPRCTIIVHRISKGISKSQSNYPFFEPDFSDLFKLEHKINTLINFS